MKKLILSLLICFCANLTISAQIQRTFFGLTLGVSTRSDVVKFYKEHNVTFDENNENNYVPNLQFGGHKWANVYFQVSDNKLYGVSFLDNELNNTQETLKITWDNLSNALYSKYSQYYNNYVSTPDKTVYMDGNTMIYISIGETMGFSTLGLLYIDQKELNKQQERNNSEL